MNPEQLIAHFKRLTASLSTQQLVTLGAVFVAVVGVLVGTAYWINTPTYTVLYSDMDAESAASVVARLKTAKVQYVLDDGGRTVKVPSERIDELRLDMSSQGMPASGRIGFEIFDRTAFGTTEFLEHVNYRRALEGELARTISTIAEVSSARVHIAMAKETLFTSTSQSAKASVVLKLKGRKPLDVQTIAGITGLVASSVEDLRPESVVVMDTFGRSLTPRSEGLGDEMDSDGMHLDRQHRLERDLTTRVVALLEPIVGDGRVRVNVAARLGADSSEQTEERWDPAAAVLRSKQSSSDVGAVPAGTLVQPGAIAGARANTPAPLSNADETGGAVLPTSPGQPPTRTSELANYEVSRVTRHTVSPSGQVARLSVAVLVDDDRTGPLGADGKAPAPKARTAEELDRLQKLVSAAVGIEQERGDQLTVVNVSFDEGEPVTPEPTPSTVQRVTTMLTSPTAIEAGRTLGVLVLGLLAFTMFLKPLMNRVLVPATGSGVALPQIPAAAGGAGGVANLPTIGALEEQMGQGREDRKLTALTRNVSKMVDDEPENVARLVRTWISDNE